MKTKSHKNKRVNVITLGCSKNLVDSEHIITHLRQNDWDAEHENAEQADIVVINTCGFIESAKQESIDTIIQYAKAKSAGQIEKLYVTGCLSQRYKDDLTNEIPEVDAFFGTLEMAPLLEKFDVDYQHELLGARVITTPPHFAYLKIAEGCSRKCSFCAIPLMRGSHKSRSIESLVQEAGRLAANGVKELILISQELTYYGIDLYQKRALGSLLIALEQVPGIEWIRLHYTYPAKFPMEILAIMAKSDKICHYLDIPLQHISDPVLKRMKRPTSKDDIWDIIRAARKQVPDIAIRTTFLVGFPGETEEDFQALMDFVQEAQLERVGVFEYSHEEGTSAYFLKDDVPSEVKTYRANQLMELQRTISERKNQDLIGTTCQVLFDRLEGDYFVGRTQYDSPEVDNEVLVPAKNTYIRIGDFAQINIVDATEYDLFGELVKDGKPVERSI